jgi:quinol monooxygenase YgiN
MYGTVARMRLKPGTEENLNAQLREFESLHVPGYLATYIYRMDDEPDIYYMAVMFESKETYVANAESPEQDTRYRRIRDLLQSDPEWHDGEIISASGPATQ